MRPEILIIGVETIDSNAMTSSLYKDELIMLDKVGLFADGAAVRQVGKLNFDICKQYVDILINVNTDEICASIKDIFEGIY